MTERDRENVGILKGNMKILTLLKNSWIDISDFTVIKFVYQEVGHRVQVSHAALEQFVLQTLVVYWFFILEKSYE